MLTHPRLHAKWAAKLQQKNQIRKFFDKKINFLAYLTVFLLLRTGV